jgi:hypothetical protein
MPRGKKASTAVEVAPLDAVLVEDLEVSPPAKSKAVVAKRAYSRKVKPKPLSVLQEAQKIIHGQRQEDYGDPVVSLNHIARLWTEVLNVEITAQEVALCMLQLKVARYTNGGQQRDSVMDMAGYIGLLELLDEDAEAGPFFPQRKEVPFD